jgi:hypothetical protein
MRHHVLMLFIIVEPKQAHLWRAQFMRIVFRKLATGDKFEGIRPGNENLDFANFVQRHSGNLVRDFLNGPAAPFLLPDRPDDFDKPLVECWIRAIELFTQLQTQVAHLQYFDLGISTIEGATFNGQHVDPHRCQSYPSGRNEGKKVSLLIRPLLVFYGNEDGEKYEDSRIASKAIGLVL